MTSMTKVRLQMAVWIALASLLYVTQARAYTPLRSKSGLKRPSAENVVRVGTARVVLADYDLLRRDFASLASLSEAQIDAWLLEKTAYISETQASQTETNTRIETTGETRSALRPGDYGRALVYETGDGGLIDGKGAGIGPGEKPSRTSHGDGLATLGEATREFLYEKLVRTVLIHAGSAFETVEHYAVIDWGFDVVHTDGSKSPAGMILRQAHQRAPGPFSLLDDASALQVETTLRRYGLSTTGAHRNTSSGELLNVQGTPNKGLLDFGAYLSVEEFKRPARNFYGSAVILQPGQIEFVQPVSSLRVPFRDWGFTVTGVDDPKMDNPWIWSHELARDFRSGLATREAFRTHFENLVGNYQRSLGLIGGAARPGAVEALIQAARHIR